MRKKFQLDKYKHNIPPVEVPASDLSFLVLSYTVCAVPALTLIVARQRGIIIRTFGSFYQKIVKKFETRLRVCIDNS